MKRVLGLIALATIALDVSAGRPFARGLTSDEFNHEHSSITGFNGQVWYTAVPERGDITCPGGGTPAPGLFPPWCPPGTRTEVRDRVLTGVVTGSDPRLNGVVTIVMNFDLNSTSFTGPIWGTFKWEIPGKGSWKGIWEGEYNGLPGAAYQFIGHGTEALDGQRLEVHAVWVTGGGERLSGRIIERDRD